MPRKFFVLFKKNKWIVLFYTLLFLILLGLVYTGFLTYKYYNLNKEISSINQKITNIDKQIKQYESIDEVRKYLLVEKLNKYLKPTKRSYIMNQLLKIYLTIDRMGSFKLENFNISLTDLSMNGTVNNLSLIYKTGGVLDQFQSLPFIENIKVPIYTRQNNSFRFNLNAKINIENATGSN